MLIRLLRADLARSAVVALTLTALIALAAMLSATGTSLATDTVTATNRLADRSRVPDLIQMHAGDADPQAIADWADTRPEIDQYDILKTLRVSRQDLTIAGVNQADSYSEPAFITSPERIDLLLDADGERVAPAPGEVALPVHYQAIGAAQIGDAIVVNTGDWSIELTVTGFFRDAQMNAGMIPSKRLIVSAEDYAALEQHLTDVEYLIEFTVVDGASPGSLLSAYTQAGLPHTGVAITSSMLTLMNSLSSMLIAAVTLVVALVLVVVAMMALRYTVLAALESDLAQIAVLKAIGTPHRSMNLLYLLKYLVLALTGAAVGWLASLPLASWLAAPTLLYLGQPPTTVWSLGLPLLSAAALAATIILFTSMTLRRVGRISAVEALRSGTGTGLRPRRHRWHLSHSRHVPAHQWLALREALRRSNTLLVGVIALCTLTMVLPTAVAATLDNPRIATYLGVGEADLRIDVPAGSQDLAAIERAVASDPRVSQHTTILRREYEMRTAQGHWESLLIDIGDHEVFPMSYLSGHAPTRAEEISLSYSQAEVAGAQVGDTVTVHAAHGERTMTVTGVYQDVTNNGLTAKAVFDDGATALWQLVYADVTDPALTDDLAEDLRDTLPGAQVNAMRDYASQFFGATGSQVRIVAALVSAVALGLSFLITVLFSILVLAREAPQIGVLKALGCTTGDLARQYLTRFGLLTLIGLATGLVLSATAGPAAIRAVLASRGAPAVQLLPNPWVTWLLIPLALVATIAGAVGLSLRRLGAVTLTTCE